MTQGVGKPCMLWIILEQDDIYFKSWLIILRILIILKVNSVSLVTKL